MVQKVAVSREFEARLRHAATGKLSLSTQQKMGTFFELGKDKAAKGEGWAPPLISCAQDTVGLQPPLPLRLLGYGKPLPLLTKVKISFCLMLTQRASENSIKRFCPCCIILRLQTLETK